MQFKWVSWIYKRLLLVADILVNLLLLGYFKYFTFFLSVSNELFDKNIPIKEIALPIGISFFPQLIASPIVKYKDIIAQLDKRQVSIKKMLKEFDGLFMDLRKSMFLVMKMDKIFRMKEL